MSVFGVSGSLSPTGGRISGGQAVLIMVGALLAIEIFVLPGPPIAVAGNDAYLSPILATIPSVIQIALFWWLSKRYGWTSPYEYLPRLLGPILGKVVAIAYIFLFVFVGASVDQEITMVLGAVFMPLTPQVVFALFSVLVAAYVAYLGIENFGRLAQLLMPLLFLVLVFISLSLLPQLDFGYILPILHRGLGPALRGATVPTAMRGEIPLLLAFLLPLMRSPERGLRLGVLATCLTAILLVLNVITVMCLLSPGEAARLTMPTLVSARMVQLIRGIEHIDFLLIMPWLIALTLKVALFVYFGAKGLASVFGAANWRPLILPTALLTGSLGGWMYPNIPSLVRTMSGMWPGYSLTMMLFLPLLLVVVSLIRGRPRA